MLHLAITPRHAAELYQDAASPWAYKTIIPLTAVIVSIQIIKILQFL